MFAGDYLKEAANRYEYSGGRFVLPMATSRSGFRIVGQQIASYNHQNFPRSRPQCRLRVAEGVGLRLRGAADGEKIRLWVAGRIPLYLLDTDFEENLEHNRSITYHPRRRPRESLWREMVLAMGNARYAYGGMSYQCCRI